MPRSKMGGVRTGRVAGVPLDMVRRGESGIDGIPDVEDSENNNVPGTCQVDERTKKTQVVAQ